jgi:hypothetical protein
VDNTSDANKPISTLTQTALNLKVNISDTASMLTPYFRDADTSLLNLTSRFNTKQNTLNGTGFVKASGTTISYDNSSYLTTGVAASTYLPLTGGTLTGALNGTTGTFTSLNANNSSDAIIGLQAGDNNLSSRIQFKHFGTIRQEIVKPNSTGNLQFRSYPTGTATGGYDFYVSNGTTELLATTIGTDRSLAVTGSITEAGNNVLTNLDTASLSNRIDSKYNSSGGTISGAVTLSTTSATPSSLLGKDGSNVVGTVTLGNTLTLTSGTLNVNNKITDINTSTYTVLSSDYYIDNKNSSSTTIVLPLAGLNTFRELKFKNSSTGALIANGNIIPLSGSGTTTTILSATNAKWCTLVSDGTDWRIMESN